MNDVLYSSVGSQPQLLVLLLSELLLPNSEMRRFSRRKHKLYKICKPLEIMRNCLAYLSIDPSKK